MWKNHQQRRARKQARTEKAARIPPEREPGETEPGRERGVRVGMGVRESRVVSGLAVVRVRRVLRRR